MASLSRITERIAFPAGQKVRRDGTYPVIENVLLCGAESANRRRYKPSAFGTGKLYEGKPVFIDHTDGRTGRKYRDQIGWIENERRNKAGLPVGDIGVKPTHELAESVCWDAEHKPANCGMSHVADCKTTRGKDGWEDVEQVVRAESVDIVIGPATTKSLYEQTHRGGHAVPQISLKTFCERVGSKYGARTWAGLTKLVEDFGDLADVPAMDEPVDGAADPGDLKTALMSALTPLLDEAFESGNSEKAASALRDFIKLHAKHTGGGGDTDPPKDDKPSEESRKPLDPAAVLAECKALQFTPTYEQGTRLAAIPDADTRKLLIESLKAVADSPARGERPRSAGRHGAEGSGLAGGKPVKESVAPATAKDFALSIKG